MLGMMRAGFRCVYYVGSKEERARRFASEVASVQFNVLVTTYEYIMRDRSKLSKVPPGQGAVCRPGPAMDAARNADVAASGRLCWCSSCGRWRSMQVCTGK